MHPEGDELLYAISKLSSTARFVRAVGERSENLDLVNALGKELDSWYVQHVVDEMRQAGVLSALDEGRTSHLRSYAAMQVRTKMFDFFRVRESTILKLKSRF